MFVLRALSLLLLLFSFAFCNVHAAPVIDINYQLLTGSVPFDANDDPGNDSSNTNAIVRTNDSVIAQFQLGVSNENETNVFLTVDAGPGISLSLPPFCLTSGVTPVSSITGTPQTGQVAICNVGDVDAGSAASYSIPGEVISTNLNGSSLTINSSSVTGDGSGSEAFAGQTVTVSAAPKFDIVKTRGATLLGSALGPAGEKGLVQLYPIIVRQINGGFGAEHAVADIVLQDDLSSVSSNALLYQGWAGALSSACFANGAVAGYELNGNPYGYVQVADGGPGGLGEGPVNQSVFDSGTFSCPTVAAGNTATITIAGAELEGSHAPTHNINGNALSVDEKYLVSGVLAIWFPVQDILDNGNELTVANTYVEQAFTSLSGQVNVDPSPGNNSDSYVIRETQSGSRNVFIGRNNGGGRLEGQTAFRSGDGSLVSGQSFTSTQRQNNDQAYSETDYNNLVLCTSFDNSKQNIRRRGSRYADVTFTGVPRTTQNNFTIEYGTGAFGGTVTCENGDSPDGWVTDPTTLPDGIASVTKVRGIGDLIAPIDALDPTRAQLRVYYSALTNPVGTILPHWGTFKSDSYNSGNWILSDYDENTALGGNGDRATLTSVVVRISKDTSPSGLSSVVAGNTLSYELDWTATLFGTPPNPTSEVTITDVIPKEYAYVADSASPVPASVTKNGDGSTQLVWLFPAAVINASQTPVTYDVFVKNTTPTGTSVFNTAVISSPDDPTPESARTSVRSMNIINTAILALFKEAVSPSVARDEVVEFELSYANTGDSTLTNLALIDVLPNNSYVRNPATSFNGSLSFVSVNTANGEQIEYTKTAVASLSQNPSDASNQSGGSTEWCTGFTGGACPASAAEVTAYRLKLPNVLLPTDGIKTFRVTLQSNGSLPTNTFTNSFSGSADELGITVTSVVAKVEVAVLFDRSDAPSDYGVADHIILSEIKLGANVDAENVALVSSDASGDGTDDDGITLPVLTDDHGVYSITPSAISATGDGTLHAWIDFDGSDSFDEDEYASVTITAGNASQDLRWTMDGAGGNPDYTLSAGDSAFARFRFTSDASVTATTPASSASNGEVEDYAIDVIAATGCPLGGGTTDLSISSYISAEVRGTGASSRVAADELDDAWRVAAGLPISGEVVPWFGYTAVDPLGNSEPGLFISNGVSIDVDFVNVEPVNTCDGTLNVNGNPELTKATNLQSSSPRPASLYNSSNQPAYWNETPGDGSNSSPNTIRFTFASPVSSFGAWFGDLETRTDGNAALGYLRLLDSAGERIGRDMAIAPTDIISGGVTSPIDQSQCGNTATDIGCGNSATRWVGFVDSAGTARVKQVLVIVGDDDFGDTGGSEHLSFIGADIYNDDFGDAPVSGLAPDGVSVNAYGEANHAIVSSLYLGASIPDVDIVNQPGADATNDDADGNDDEDGITLADLTEGDASYTITIGDIAATGTGTLHAWIDFDGNGTFDADEHDSVDVTAGSVSQALSWTLDGAGGNPDFTLSADSTTFVRIRFTSDLTVTASTPASSASDGEVEDYAITIKVAGYTVSGRVYKDSNVDGVNEVSEDGVSALPVVLMKVETNPADNTCVSTRTDAGGHYAFALVLPGTYQVYEASRENVPVPINCGIANARDPSSYVSTTDNVSASFDVVDSEVTDIDFGDVKLPTFSPDHSGSVLPGNVTFYAHKFDVQSTGTVDFSTSHSGGASGGWTNVLYQDVNCNGQLDGSEGDTPVGSNIATVAGTPICLINKVYAPSNAVSGEAFSNNITADFWFAGNPIAGSVSLAVVDVTTVAANDENGASRLELKKTVQTYRGVPLSAVTVESETQNTALPSDVLRYRIYYSNTGNASLTDLVISDVVPEFTSLSGSPACAMPLPESLSSCIPAVNGSDITWTFLATDELKAGEGGLVSYDVIID